MKLGADADDDAATSTGRVVAFDLTDSSSSESEEELEVLQAWTPTVAPWKISKAGKG